MVVLREGVEAFLIVAITFAYLRKTAQTHLLSAVNWGIGFSVLLSTLLGYVLWVNQGANQPLWEGIFASITVVLIASLIVHMWRTGPQLKQAMERELSEAAAKPETRAAFWGILFFTVIMISREGMEMMLLLFQIQGDPRMVVGIALGAAASIVIALLWQQFGYLINLKRFFQITAIYLSLFTLQIAVQAFHEFTEAGIFPDSETLHIASEPYSTEGVYGKWYGNFTFALCGLALMASLIFERPQQKIKPLQQKIQNA